MPFDHYNPLSPLLLFIFALPPPSPPHSFSPSLPFLVLDGKLLTRAVVAAVHHVCKEWTENLPSLTCPRQRFDISIYSAKNGRRKMEDRHSICMDINTLYGLKVFCLMCIL